MNKDWDTKNQAIDQTKKPKQSKSIETLRNDDESQVRNKK